MSNEEFNKRLYIAAKEGLAMVIAALAIWAAGGQDEAAARMALSALIAQVAARIGVAATATAGKTASAAKRKSRASAPPTDGGEAR